MKKVQSRKKSVLLQMFGGYILTLISIVQGVFLIPLYLKYIEYEMYGYWITTLSIVSLLSMVNFEYSSFIVQRISSNFALHNHKKVVDYFLNGLFVFGMTIIAMFILAGVIYYFGIDYISVPISSKETLTTAYILAIITMAFTILNNALRSFSQAILQPLFNIYSTIIFRTLGIVIVLYLLFNGSKLLAIPISLLISETSIFILDSGYVFYQYKLFNITAKFNKDILLEYLSITPNVFGLKVGDVLSSQTHPLLITSFLGAEMTTAYSVTKKMADLVFQMIIIINGSFSASFSHLVGEGNKEKIVFIMKKIFFAIFIVSLIGFGTYIGINSIFIVLWVNENVLLSSFTITLIGFSSFSYLMTKVMRSFLFGLSQFQFTSNIIFIEGIIFVSTSALLMNSYSINALLVTLLITSLTVNSIFGYRLIKYTELKVNNIINFKSIIFIFTYIILIIFLQTIEHANNTWFVLMEQSFIVFLSILVVIYIFYFKDMLKAY